MKIKNANIEYSKGSVVLKYPISPDELLAIKKDRLYNFQENFFEADLPTTFGEGVISIIAEQNHADHFKEGEEITAKTLLAKGLIKTKSGRVPAVKILNG